MKKLIITSLTGLIFSLNINSQNSVDKFWLPISESKIQVQGKRQIIPKKYVTFQVNTNELKTQLKTAQPETSVKINESLCIISLPAPNGSIQKFKVVESSIMEPGLASQFPDIKTYSLKGIDDPYANGKLDCNEFGFHGMVRSINGDFFIDPYCLNNTTDYLIYYTADFEKDASQKLPEIGVITNTKTEKNNNPSKKKDGSEKKVSSLFPATCVGAQLRTYRLAVACTGEYAVAATGISNPSIAQVLSKIVTTVNRVDGVYETEVAIRLVLVST
jgi:hypothetical protein